MKKTKLKFTDKALAFAKVMLVAVIFCGCSQKLDSPKYKVGDIVYMKPDSTKAIIIDDDVMGGEYEIQYSVVEDKWTRQYCNENEIYGTECSKK
jgi:hypothetical protein